MVKILKYDNPDHKIKLKIRQFQLMGKSAGQINNIGFKCRVFVKIYHVELILW